MTQDQAVEVLVTRLGYSEDAARELTGEAVAKNGYPVDLGAGRHVRYEVPSAANHWDRRGGFSVRR
jgi:hypothetical protein